MKIRIALVCAWILTPSLVIAGPSRTIEYLMNDYASMLDLGMDKLHRELSGMHLQNGVNIVASPSYNWDANRIQISLFTISNPKNIAKAKEECKEAIAVTRQRLGIASSTGKPYFGNAGLLSALFTHAGYKDKNAPDIDAEIGSITYIDSFVASNLDTKNAVTARCSAKLIGGEIFFSEK